MHRCFTRHATAILLLGALALALGPAAGVARGQADESEATKRGGGLRYQQSASLPFYSWADLSYTISNPGAKDADVMIRLTPEGQRNVTVFETLLTVGAGLRYASQNPVTAGTVNTYGVDLYLDRRLVSDQNSRLNLVSLANPGDRFIVFINDDADLSYGQFRNNDNLGAVYINALNQVELAATHFASYDNAHLVVLFRPDFAQMTTRQYAALLDYVSRGGTLVFGDPAGALAAAATPLRQCLPVTPLRLRLVDRLDALGALGGQPVVCPAGLQFLEALPRGEGLTTLTHDGLPLVRWGRFGLGKVGCCALNPSAEPLRREHHGLNFNVYWRHLLSFGGRLSYASSARDPNLAAALDKLTGIEIPPPSLIRNLLLAYLALVLAFVSAGFVCRRHLQAWLALGVVAVLAALGILAFARYRQRNLSPKTATVFEFANLGVAHQTGEQLVSLTLKHDQTLALPNANADLLLRAPPPPRHPGAPPGATLNYARMRATPKPDPAGPSAQSLKRGEARYGEDEELRDPLTITVADGRSSFTRLVMSAGRPQFFASLYTRRGETCATLPAVRWTTAGPEIKPWPLPAGLQPEYAVLVGEAGCRPLRLSGGQLALTPGDRAALLQPGAEYVALSEYLARNPTPAPAVALFSRLHADPSGFLAPPAATAGDSPFTVVGRQIQLLPLLETLGGDPLTVPYERIRVVPRQSQARVLQEDGEWVKSTVGPTVLGPPEYELDCHLPPGYNRLIISELQVDFAAESRGGNLDFRFAALRGPGGPRLPLASRPDGTYAAALTPADAAAAVSPSDGRFTLVLTAAPRQEVRDPVARRWLNTWKIVRLRVAATGELPATQRGSW